MAQKLEVCRSVWTALVWHPPLWHLINSASIQNPGIFDIYKICGIGSGTYSTSIRFRVWLLPKKCDISASENRPVENCQDLDLLNGGGLVLGLDTGLEQGSVTQDEDGAAPYDLLRRKYVERDE
jgi:hypothetical protein